MDVEEQHEGEGYEEVWIQVENQPTDGDSNDTHKESNITHPTTGAISHLESILPIPISPSISSPAASPLTSPITSPATSPLISPPVSPSDAKKIKLELHANKSGDDNHKSSATHEVISVSETVTIKSNGITAQLTSPAKPKSSETKVEEKGTEKHIVETQTLPKLPSFAYPSRSTPTKSFSVLRTKSGEIVPRYTDSISKVNEKPNFTLPNKARNTPTKALPFLSSKSGESGFKSSENLLKSVESGKSDTPRDDKHSESSPRILTRTISSSAKTEETPASPIQGKVVYTISKSNSSSNSSEQLVKPESSEIIKSNEPSPFKLPLPKSRESSFTTLIRTKSNENIAKVEDTKSRSTDPPKEDGKVNLHEVEAPKSPKTPKTPTSPIKYYFPASSSTSSSTSKSPVSKPSSPSKLVSPSKSTSPTPSSVR